MADELYPGYSPEIDPWPITCWGYDFHHESIERARRLLREAEALWFWDDPTKENGRASERPTSSGT